MTGQRPEFPALLRPGEAAAALGVNVRTLARWTAQGKVEHQRTAGGHRRYTEADIERAKARFLQERS